MNVNLNFNLLNEEQPPPNTDVLVITRSGQCRIGRPAQHMPGIWLVDGSHAGDTTMKAEEVAYWAKLPYYIHEAPDRPEGPFQERLGDYAWLDRHFIKEPDEDAPEYLIGNMRVIIGDGNEGDPLGSVTYTKHGPVLCPEYDSWIGLLTSKQQPDQQDLVIGTWSTLKALGAKNIHPFA